MVRLRHPFAVAVVSTLVLIGCGGDDETTTTTAATTTTSASARGDLPVCGAYAEVQSAGEDLRQLGSGSSPDQVGEAAAAATASVKALSSAASEATSETRSNIQSAVSRFKAEIEGLSIAERLATIGTALSELERSLEQTASRLKCGA